MTQHSSSCYEPCNENRLKYSFTIILNIFNSYNSKLFLLTIPFEICMNISILFIKTKIEMVFKLTLIFILLIRSTFRHACISILDTGSTKSNFSRKSVYLSVITSDIHLLLYTLYYFDTPKRTSNNLIWLKGNGCTL